MRIRGGRFRSARISNGDAPSGSYSEIILSVLEDSEGNPLVFASGCPIMVADTIALVETSDDYPIHLSDGSPLFAHF